MIKIFNGVPVNVPNTTENHNDYYISFNKHDIGLYGCETTALVPNDSSYFYILNGDHRRAYSRLKDQGFNACLEYFKSHYRGINKFSDIPGHSWSSSEIVQYCINKK